MHLSRTMPTDFLTLLRRDHAELQDELTQLLEPSASIAEMRTALDGVRLGLIAHSEAEDIVLAAFDLIPELEILIAQARAAHVVEEKALSALVTARPQTSIWRDRAYQLRELVEYHAVQEETYLLPALRYHVPPDHYRKLAGSFATQRLRQFAMLQPSGLYPLPGLAAEAQAS